MQTTGSGFSEVLNLLSTDNVKLPRSSAIKVFRSKRFMHRLRFVTPPTFHTGFLVLRATLLHTFTYMTKHLRLEIIFCRLPNNICAMTLQYEAFEMQKVCVMRFVNYVSE